MKMVQLLIKIVYVFLYVLDLFFLCLELDFQWDADVGGGTRILMVILQDILPSVLLFVVVPSHWNGVLGAYQGNWNPFHQNVILVGLFRIKIHLYLFFLVIQLKKQIGNVSNYFWGP